MTYTTESNFTQSVTGNRDFNVGFPFLATTDLKVQKNGTTVSLTSDYTIVQSGANTTVNFNTAPAVNDTVRIFRNTDIDAIQATYAAGSSIRSTDLNSNNTQLLYAAQEFGTLKTDNSVSFSLGNKGDIQINSSSDWVIKDNSIENSMMADNSVGTNELVNGSITGNKLASLSISTSQLANTAVTTDKITNASVTADKLASNSVTLDKIAANSIDPTKLTQTAAAGHGFNPPGTVIWYAGSSAPTGYLKCNGDSITNGSGTVQGVSADFSGLYAIVGGNVPDLRGEFIRGWDDNREVDDGRSIRTTQGEGYKQHTHSPVVSSSLSSNGDHNHAFKASNRAGDEDGGGWQGLTNKGFVGDNDGAVHTQAADTNKIYDNGSHTHTLSVGVSIGNSGGTETRPRNVALLACIKY